jgi:hypothetical protein
MHPCMFPHQIPVEMSGQGHGKHWIFDHPRLLEPRVNTTLMNHLFKFLQVKNHVSLSALLSTLGQFRIASSDASHSHTLWNSKTLTRFDFLVFQKQV